MARTFGIRTLFLLALILPLAACQNQGLENLGNAIRDDDDDGWFTNDTNQRVSLILVRATTSPGAGDYHFIVNDARYPLAEDLQGTVPVNALLGPLHDIELDRRNVGTWLLDQTEQRFNWTTEVEVFKNEQLLTTINVPWSNTDDQFDISDGDLTLYLETRLEKFSDPSPDDAEGDTDNDGITDRDEAYLASWELPVGDPAKRDILTIVGYTHPDWALTDYSRELLTTRFRQRGFNCLYMTKSITGLDADPGQATLPSTTVDRSFVLELAAHADVMRDRHIGPRLHPFAFYLVLAEELYWPSEDSNPYGQAWFFGRVHIVKSHLPVLGPDIHQYQAKTIMHELGHNLGLCHPTRSDASCPSGPIPQSERDPSASVLGTPAEAENIFDTMVQALSRPLNYSPGQWTNLDVAAGAD